MILELSRWLTLAALLFAALELAYSLIPVAALKLMERGYRKAGLALCCAAVALPPIRGWQYRVNLRRALGNLYYADKKYVEALFHFDLLARLPDTVDCSIESVLNCGDSLKALGRIDEARLAWNGAASRVASMEDGYRKFDILTQSAGRLGDKPTAYVYQKKVLAYCVGTHADIRSTKLIQLAGKAAALQNYSEMLQWAEQAIAGQSAPYETKANAYSLAGDACIRLRDFAGAEPFFSTLLEIAQLKADQKHIDKAQMRLAAIDELSGRLEKAVDRILRLGGRLNELLPIFTLSTCYAWMGRHEEALESFRFIADRQAGNSSTEQTRFLIEQARLGCARACMRLGRWQDAEQYYSLCSPSLEKDPKYREMLRAGKALLAARRGDHETARALLAESSTRLTEILEQPSAVQRCLTDIPAAYIDLGEFARALELLATLRGLQVYPIVEPLYYRLVGESEAGLGNYSEAQEAYRSAVSLGINSEDARICAERVNDISS